MCTALGKAVWVMSWSGDPRCVCADAARVIERDCADADPHAHCSSARCWRRRVLTISALAADALRLFQSVRLWKSSRCALSSVVCALSTFSLSTSAECSLRLCHPPHCQCADWRSRLGAEQLASTEDGENQLIMLNDVTLKTARKERDLAGSLLAECLYYWELKCVDSGACVLLVR